MKIFNKKTIVIFTLFVSILSNSCAQNRAVKTFNVRDYGAVGNGITDDYAAIQKCFDDALKLNDSKVLFPSGKYSLSKGLVAHYINNNLEILGNTTNGVLPAIICKSPVSALSIRGYFDPKALGTIKISNLKIQGGFAKYPYSDHNPYVNKKQWFTGLSITDKRKITINNVIVSDFYGQGIYISSTQQTDIPLTARAQQVSITNSKVLNCWGFNPAADDYGDGIYLSNVASAVLRNNIIRNDFKTTKQLGRCGIVLEFMAEDCIIEKNQIFGYDRGIHLEADYGGHLINGNSISGSDMGIVLYNTSIAGHNKPVKITNNTISNTGFPKGTTLKRTRDISAISDRSLMNFVALDGSRSGSLIQDNSFIISGDYDYFSNTIVNIKADKLLIKNNKYSVVKANRLKYPILYNNYSNSVPVGDAFIGVESLKFKKANLNSGAERVRAQNKLNTTRITLDL
ncbi:glycosyl hydrolase family 28-related protein [Pedobacter sp. MC2016-15]|uniref:glycosyl hydrolase family 28-related protein n=1 Tax=Pedobacter sp. MC2016-15 TaxID=2994473 RepID=UPI0022455B19|nr:glycosyl hydrolase family 28-related protein [Pedobacter sp. MC2016-15]MCX2481809.1 glycosyl hydrolase family 28-related protein [Pedobacter sp. MC2016-15]